MAEAEPPEQFSIRRASPADWKILHKLDSICFPPEIAFSAELFVYHLEDPRSVCLLAETAAKDSPKLAGFVIAETRRAAGWIITLDVEPTLRRAGLATTLMKECEAEMKRRRARRMVLEVAANNDAALGLYAKLGYRPLGRIPGYYAHPEPFGTDAILMEKAL